MLPVFTTQQVKDGVDTGDLLIDLSDYMKKKDAATKIELESLTAIVAGKLDATPQHKHDISNIKDLREELDSKYDTSKQYSYNVILSDAEKIPFLEKPRVNELDISANKEIDGYRFYVDEKSGDLMIVLNEVLIASYSIASGKWSFETDTTGVETSIDNLDKRVDEHDAVLENHCEALDAVCNATLKNITDISACNSNIAENSDAIKNHTHSEYVLTTDYQTRGLDKITYDAYTGHKIDMLTVGGMIIGDDYGFMLSNSTSGSGATITLSKPLNILGSLNVKQNVTISGTLTVNGTDILAKINSMDAILKNHYDALLLLCQKHGMVDSNTTDGNNITPQ